MSGPVLVRYKRQGPNTQGAGQIINNHTNKKTVSSDDAMLGMYGQLPEMAILQTRESKGVGQYSGCILMPRSLEKSDFYRVHALQVIVRIRQGLSERETQETSKGSCVYTRQDPLTPTSQ